MEQTSRLSIVIDMGNAESNLARLRQLLHDTNTAGNSLSSTLSAMGRNNPFSGFANSMSATTNSMQRLNNTTNSMNGGLGRLNGQMNAINRSSGQARSSIQSLAGSVAHLNGRFYDANGRLHEANGRFVSVGNSMAGVGRGANTLSSAFGGLQRQIQGLQSSFANLQSLFMGGFFASIALGVGRTADTMQNLHSQIKLVTSSSEEYQVIQERLHEMANKNLTNVQATIGLYTNSARSLGQMGKSQEEVLKFTNAISLAMNVGGKSAQEQAAALLQLGQAMQSGVVQGDEFRSLAENAPILLDLVAESLGKTRGEVRELSKEGKITAEVMYNAVANATPKLQAMFDKMPTTMAQGFTVLTNEYKKFTHEMMNGEGGISSTIAKGLIGISKHFETLAKVAIAGAGVAVVGYTNRLLVMTQAKIASTVATTGLSGAVTRLGLVLKAHPVMALATVIIGTSVATRGLDETLNDLGNTLSVIGSMIGDVINLFADLGSSAYTIFQDIVSSADNTTKTSSQLFGGFFNDVGSGFQGMLVGTGKVFDAMATTVKTFGQFAGENIAYFVNNAGNLFKILANKTADVFENIVNGVIGTSVNFIIGKINTVIETGNKAAELFGSDPLPLLDPYKSQFKIGNRYQISGMVQTRTWGELFDDNAKFQTDNGAAQYVRGKYSGLNTEFKSDLNNPMGKAQQTKPKDDKDKGKDKNGNKKSNKDNIKPLKVNDTVLAHAKKYDYAGLEREFNLPSGTLASLEMQESGGNPYARSSVGALGAFQFMPKTAKEYGISGKEHNVAASARAAAQYLSELQKQFGSWELAVAAYNAGPGNVKKYGNAIPPFKETQNYVKNIKGHLKYLNGGMDGNTNLSQIIDNENKNDHRAQQVQQDTLMMFLPKGDRDAQEFKELVENIRKTYAHNDALREELLNEAMFSYKNQVKYNETDFELKTRGHEMTALQKAQKEYELGYYDVMSKKDLTREQKGELIKPLAAELQDKVNVIVSKELETDLELNGWRMNFTERIKLEKSLAQTRLALEKNIVGDQKTAWEQAIEERYQFLEQKHATEQSEKVKEIDKLNEAARKGSHYASLLDFMAKNQWSKSTYDKWALKNTHDAQLGEEEERYGDITKQINAQDDNGNYIIESEKERQRLLENALIVHEQTKHAIKERYAQESEQLEKERFRHSVQAYGAAFGEMSNLIKAFGGEQSKSYRAMFAVSKAFALADIGINMGKAISQAWGDPSATTIWQKMANVAKVTLAEGYLMQVVNAVTPKGFATGGYTGNIGTSQIAGVVHGQEYVLNAKATKRIGRNTLDRLNSGEAVGGQVNVIINNYSNEKATVEQQPNGDLLVVVGAVAQGAARAEINKFVRQESRQGGLFNK